MNIARLLETASRVYPDNVAVAWVDQPIHTYASLFDRASRIAGGLLSSGLKSGDRVVLAMSNTAAYPEILFACWIAGLIAAPMNCRLHPREIVDAAGDCSAACCIATSELSADIRSLVAADMQVIDIDDEAYGSLVNSDPVPVADVTAESPAWLFYTSGTTGKSKGAILTHRTLWAATVSFLADSGAVETDNVIHMAPLSHASGFLALAYLSRGRTNVILPTGSFDAAQLGAALKAFGPASFWAVPTLLKRLCKPDVLPDALLPSVFRIFFGGAPTYAPDMQDNLARFGAGRLWHLYGQGEAPMTLTHLPPRLWPAADHPDFDKLIVSVGIPRSGMSVRVLKESGGAAAPGEIGEVVAKGDIMMSGYWNNPAATRSAIPDGWLRTGDIGFMDERGFLTLVDRSKDVIISGGSNIYPRELEDALLDHPNVSDCSVIGVPDPDWGEIPVAFIISSSEVLAADLDRHCLARLGRYKRPKAYRFVDSFPVSGYGKVLKRELLGIWRREHDAG